MIEVGEYVRTKRGIAKILEIKTVATKMYGKHDKAYRIDKTRMYVTETEFLKHSKNIIELIEVGDYVNGDKVVAIDYTEDENGNYVDVLGIMEIDDDYAYPIELRVIDIKSIVTKEQFAQLEYRLEG